MIARQVRVRRRSGDVFLRLRLFAQEAHQLRVDFLCMRPGDAVRPAFHDVQASALDHFGGAGAGRSDRNNAVLVAVDDKRWHINTFQVLAEVLVPSRNTCQVGDRRCASSNVPTGFHDLLADPLAQELIGVVEVLVELREEGVAGRRPRLS